MTATWAHPLWLQRGASRPVRRGGRAPVHLVGAAGVAAERRRDVRPVPVPAADPFSRGVVGAALVGARLTHSWGRDDDLARAACLAPSFGRDHDLARDAVLASSLGRDQDGIVASLTLTLLRSEERQCRY